MMLKVRLFQTDADAGIPGERDRSDVQAFQALVQPSPPHVAGRGRPAITVGIVVWKL